MDWDRKSIRIGAAVIGCAVGLRLLCGGLGNWLLRTVTSPQLTSVMLFFETGHVIKTPTVTAGDSPADTEPSVGSGSPAQQTPAEPGVPVFSVADAHLVEVNNICGYETDVAADLTQALTWDLTAEAPAVLILHSHGTEGYREQAEGGYRSENTEENMIAIGDRLVQVLEAGGVRAVHDRQLHDSPSYSAAYGNARESIEYYLEQYPTIRLVLDIHRDAVESSDGTQTGFVTQVDGESTAQLMLVVGTDASGLSHPYWPENMSLAVKLQALLEKRQSGICRPISFRSQRFNQDLSTGALLLEMGAAGNSRQEALLATEFLADAIIELAKGTG